ncbi:MAG: hypothetical protein HZA31_07900 [Opitutae bacterium]|nr:hypothetical protein [Opitutae bacterium]
MSISFTSIFHRRPHQRWLWLILGLALALGALSRWLDRPATLPTVSIEHSDAYQAQDAEVLSEVGVRVRVWKAQAAAPTVVRTTFNALPRHAALAFAVAGPLAQPIRVTVQAPGKQIPEHIELLAPNSNWQVVSLPTLEKKNGQIIVTITLSEATEKARITELFFTDITHRATARIIGRLSTAGLSFLWIALLATAAACLLEKHNGDLASSHLVFKSICLLALGGYLAFWAYFAHPRIGDTFAVALVIGSFCWLQTKAGGQRASMLWSDAQWWRPWLVIGGVGLLYLGLLHLRACDANWSWLAANRYRSWLPIDNEIPQYFARRLLDGQSPRQLCGDWLSSDRPPLQAGWILLLGPCLRPTDTALFDSMSQAMGFWLQLLWVPAVAAWLQLLGLGLRRTMGLIGLLAANAFFLINTLYVWPKLAAAGFVLGGWVLWRSASNPRPADWIWVGITAALGFLSHGGVAFSLLPLAPLLLWSGGERRWRGLFYFGVAALIVCLPWFLYQRYYEPPGNRLLKWHLAGVITPDQRGTLATLRDVYFHTPPAELLKARQANANYLCAGDWSELFNFRPQNPGNRLNEDFFFLFRSLGWWSLGWAALPFVWWRMGRNPDKRSAASLCHALLWSGASIAIWVLLLWEPNSAIIHQGSYVPLLLFFSLTVWAMSRLHGLALAGVALAACAYFAALYVAATPEMLPSKPVGMALAAAVAGLLATLCAAGWPLPVRRT